MTKIDLNTPNHVHFIGIGGISMSGLAEILIGKNFTVSGSDMSASKTTQHLKTLGATIQIGHSAQNITTAIDLIVYTAAIAPDNAELLEAASLQIPTIDRAALLGEIMDQYGHAVAVSGTHGKTTTTSMVSHILLTADLDPTISVGGMLKVIDGNIRVGKSDYFVTEACEYHNSFHKFNPTVSIILNVDEDHLDFFKDITEIRQSFNTFAHRLPADGVLLVNSEIEQLSLIIEPVAYQVKTFGKALTNTYAFDNVHYDTRGCATFNFYTEGENLGAVQLNVPGEHNVYNALSAIGAAFALGISLETAKVGLLGFYGADRRFEIKGDLMGVTVVDDYAHHPTEIRGTVTAAKRMDYNDLWVVFQPHTYSRTKLLFDDFVDALSDVDHLIITDIYAARELNPGDIHAKDLVAKISERNPNCFYIESFDEIEAFLLTHCVPKDLLITMGAGNVYLIGEDLLNG